MGTVGSAVEDSDTVKDSEAVGSS